MKAPNVLPTFGESESACASEGKRERARKREQREIRVYLTVKRIIFKILFPDYNGFLRR